MQKIMYVDFHNAPWYFLHCTGGKPVKKNTEAQPIIKKVIITVVLRTGQTYSHCVFFFSIFSVSPLAVHFLNTVDADKHKV